VMHVGQVYRALRPQWQVSIAFYDTIEETSARIQHLR
jgi:hypothetical protein